MAVRDNLTPSNVTAKIARELFVLKVLKSPKIELELVGKNLSPKAIYQLPFKVTVENKLRCFQYKIIHGILPTNKRLFKMGLKTSPRCERCNFPNETLVHLLYECPITQSFWREIVNWWNEKRSEKTQFATRASIIVIIRDTVVFFPYLGIAFSVFQRARFFSSIWRKGCNWK